MRDMPFSEKRERAQELLATAFSLDYLTVVEYEQRVQELAAAETFDAVDRLVADLPHSLAPGGPATGALALAGDAQILEGSGQVVRKRGNWLRSNRLVIRQNAAILRLRMDDLAELRNARVEVELDLNGSMVRIYVPRGTHIEDTFQSSGSVFRISRRLTRHTEPGGSVIRLVGRITNSVLRIKPL